MFEFEKNYRIRSNQFNSDQIQMNIDQFQLNIDQKNKQKKSIWGGSASASCSLCMLACNLFELAQKWRKINRSPSVCVSGVVSNCCATEFVHCESASAAKRHP